MSTSDIKSYFERFATTLEALQVSWLNDSSCKVKFECEELARRAYNESALSTSDGNSSHSLHIGQAVVDGTSGEVDERNFDPNLGWREILGF